MLQAWWTYTSIFLIWLHYLKTADLHDFSRILWTQIPRTDNWSFVFITVHFLLITGKLENFSILAKTLVPGYRTMSETGFRRTWKVLHPNIVTARPMTDLCRTCYNSTLLMRKSQILTCTKWSGKDNHTTSLSISLSILKLYIGSLSDKYCIIFNPYNLICQTLYYFNRLKYKDRKTDKKSWRHSESNSNSDSDDDVTSGASKGKGSFLSSANVVVNYNFSS